MTPLVVIFVYFYYQLFCLQGNITLIDPACATQKNQNPLHCNFSLTILSNFPLPKQGEMEVSVTFYSPKVLFAFLIKPRQGYQYLCET